MRTTPSILAMALVSGLAAAAGAQILQADHFDTSIAGSWVKIKGNQWWEDGWLHNQHTDPVFVNGRDSAIVTHMGDMTWLNYTTSARVDPILTQAFSGEYWKRADFMFRISNFEYSYYAYGPHATGYAVSLVCPGDADVPRVILSRFIDGASIELGRVAPWDGGSNGTGPYDIAVTADGPHITVSIGDTLMFDVVDEGGPAFGGLALTNVWESHARFDDVITIPLPADSCSVDFNGDGFVDFFDYDAFVEAFENGC